MSTNGNAESEGGTEGSTEGGTEGEIESEGWDRSMSIGFLDEISSTENDGEYLDASYVPKKLLGCKSYIENITHPSWRESRVLVVYTGGTIGMVRNEEGKLVPLVRELEQKIRQYPHMNDKNYESETITKFVTPPLVLPCTQDTKRVLYWVYEYSPLLDSSNMTMDDWIRVGNDIMKVYERFDGFVILHGTDTLAYTASALSFMLENLGKHVVITGSQIPLFETRSDGRDNFIGSLIMAGIYNIPEVTIFFNNRLYRGNRTTKISSGRLQAFDSPNMSPLAVAGISIQVDFKAIFRPITLEKFKVYDRLERNVALLRIFPSISCDMVRSCLQPPTMGVVLQTYGAGNIPSNRKDIVHELKEASNRGVIIVNITQCLNGFVEAIYETGQAIEEAGVLPGLDMTPEAALTKLSYVLSRSDWDYEQKRMMMVRNIRGEMTVLSTDSRSDGNTADIFAAITQALQLSTEEDMDEVKRLIVPNLFFEAVANSDINRMEKLFDYDGSGDPILEINHQDISGWSALHLAASRGSYETVKWLLEHGASVYIRDKNDHTPLWLAVINSHHQVIEILKQTGSYLNETPSRLSQAMTEAVAASDFRRLKAFHLAGIDFGHVDTFGRTPLHAACTLGFKECVDILLSYGAPIDTKDKTGLTPLACAELNGKKDIISMIVKRKKSVANK